MISLPWIALSLVTELVTVALDCPRLPTLLVTELVTPFATIFGIQMCSLGCMQASFSVRAGL